MTTELAFRATAIGTRQPDQARILVVDDEVALRGTLARVLQTKDHICDTAGSAVEARDKVEMGGFDLMLTDMTMPGESGLDLIDWARKEHPDLGVIMITGMDDPTLADAATRLGAYGYVIKPFQPNEILIAVSNALRRRALEVESRAYTRDLEHAVQLRTADLTSTVARLAKVQTELRESQTETINRLAKAAELRDDGAEGHIERVSEVCALLARELGYSKAGCELVRMASRMHDVGKLGVPDEILLKPDRLSPAEFELMKNHTTMGYDILMGSKSTILHMAATIALTHHERIDGHGYPNGLIGDGIPEVGRIVAVADVFDAVTSDRVYRGALPLEESLKIMQDGEGCHFDPAILAILFRSLDEVLAIGARSITS